MAILFPCKVFQPVPYVCVRQFIPTHGEVIDLHGPHALDDVRTMLGAQDLRVIRLRERGQIMLADDQAHVKALPLNQRATRIYFAHTKQAAQPIPVAGDVIIVPDDDFALPSIFSVNR